MTAREMRVRMATHFVLHDPALPLPLLWPYVRAVMNRWPWSTGEAVMMRAHLYAARHDDKRRAQPRRRRR